MMQKTKFRDVTYHAGNREHKRFFYMKTATINDHVTQPTDIIEILTQLFFV